MDNATATLVGETVAAAAAAAPSARRRSPRAATQLASRATASAIAAEDAAAATDDERDERDTTTNSTPAAGTGGQQEAARRRDEQAGDPTAPRAQRASAQRRPRPRGTREGRNVRRRSQSGLPRDAGGAAGDDEEDGEDVAEGDSGHGQRARQRPSLEAESAEDELDEDDEPFGDDASWAPGPAGRHQGRGVSAARRRRTRGTDIDRTDAGPRSAPNPALDARLLQQLIDALNRRCEVMEEKTERALSRMEAAVSAVASQRRDMSTWAATAEAVAPGYNAGRATLGAAATAPPPPAAGTAPPRDDGGACLGPGWGGAGAGAVWDGRPAAQAAAANPRDAGQLADGQDRARESVRTRTLRQLRAMPVQPPFSTVVTGVVNAWTRANQELSRIQGRARSLETLFDLATSWQTGHLALLNMAATNLDNKLAASELHVEDLEALLNVLLQHLAIVETLEALMRSGLAPKDAPRLWTWLAGEVDARATMAATDSAQAFSAGQDDSLFKWLLFWLPRAATQRQPWTLGSDPRFTPFHKLREDAKKRIQEEGDAAPASRRA